MHKMPIKCYFFKEIFGHFKKKQYFCTLNGGMCTQPPAQLTNLVIRN